MAHWKSLTDYSVPTPGKIGVHGLAYSAVPAGSNQAQVAWQQVAVEYTIYRNLRFGGGTQARVSVPPAVQADLDAGVLFEWVWWTEIDQGLSLAARDAAITAYVDGREAAMMQQLGAELANWGRIRVDPSI